MACRCNGQCPNIAPVRAMLEKGEHGRAHGTLRNILTMAPLCVEANLAIAPMLYRSNHGPAGLAHVERAATAGETSRTHFERAGALRAMMQLEKALPELDLACQAEPENPLFAALYAGTLEVAGRLADAKAVVDTARAKFPAHGELARVAAAVADAMGDTEGAAALLDRADLEPVALLDRGRYLDKLGRHGEAWQVWAGAKATMREKFGHRYRPELFEKNHARLKTAATAPRPFFVRRAPELATDPAPLFICGYPRSGTTLLETILSCHSAIVAGDELPGLGDIVAMLPGWLRVRVPYPEAMPAASLGENSAVPVMARDFYMNQAQERIGFAITPRRAGKSRKKPFYFSDKMPLNELHLPLIRMLFPTAPVVRLQRHPLDVIVSCMGQWLPQGGFYASSVEACAHHYKEVDGVTEFYRAEFLKADRHGWKTVRYESLVADQAGITAEILAGLQLAMEPACLAHHKNKRTARTLSHRQVKQPIHSASVGRWKNYRDQLAPAVEILRPILEREGYEF